MRRGWGEDDERMKRGRGREKDEKKRMKRRGKRSKRERRGTQTFMLPQHKRNASRELK
jgi:hypothetical protein